MEKENMKTKRCGKCKKLKSSDKFGKDKWTKDGLTRNCKICIAKDSRIRYVKKHPEAKHRKKHLIYSESHRIINKIVEKLCPKCRKWKSLNEFTEDKSRKDNRYCWCKVCRSKNVRDRREKKNPNARKILSYAETHRTINGAKKKRCPKCKRFKPLDEFSKGQTTKDKLHSWCKGCARIYQQSENGKTSKAKSENKRKHTIKGQLRVCFRDMNHRCNNPKTTGYCRYGAKGIKNLFRSFDAFFIYVTVDLGLTYGDIKGKQIHRIHNNNYEPGEIEFLTRKEHGAKHREINRRKC